MYRDSYNLHIMISIHALREEGDVPAYQLAGEDTNFYPRPPRGGRHARPGGRGFLSWISIHALREEGDTSKRLKFYDKAYFYPRPPRGGRPSV